MLLIGYVDSIDGMHWEGNTEYKIRIRNTAFRVC